MKGARYNIKIFFPTIPNQKVDFRRGGPITVLPHRAASQRRADAAVPPAGLSALVGRRLEPLLQDLSYAGNLLFLLSVNSIHVVIKLRLLLKIKPSFFYRFRLPTPNNYGPNYNVFS